VHAQPNFLMAALFGSIVKMVPLPSTAIPHGVAGPVSPGALALQEVMKRPSAVYFAMAP
jgi:hypothetical protein